MNSLLEIRRNEEVTTYKTSGGIQVSRQKTELPYDAATDNILRELDTRKGALFTSRYEYPGRYSRWDVGFYNPMIEVRSLGNQFEIQALNGRGSIFLEGLIEQLDSVPHIDSLTLVGPCLSGRVKTSPHVVDEEIRSRQPSIFTVVRAIKEFFSSDQDAFLGLYGAFGYDLVFQFEPIPLKHERTKERNDLVLYIPDQLVVVDHEAKAAFQLSYEFMNPNTGKTTEGLERSGSSQDPILATDQVRPPFKAGSYASQVKIAKGAFKRGDLFEVVPSHSIFEKCEKRPTEVFARLQTINPSPYGFIINLGNQYLVGSSPEMYVRTEGKRVETCPISGTIKRGRNAMEDAAQIRTLLNSTKDENELTMCTDVDRNDKSRICEPGSVNVIGRRQIELYSHLIHTVDHVEGRLRPEFDALDAFLTHMWAVTVTGAPKKAAIRWIEEHEASPRGWYGGAVGWFSFNGDLNTGLTLRTMNIKNGEAEIRVGATLLYDSDPEAEEQETLTKAGALLQAVRSDDPSRCSYRSHPFRAGAGKRVMLVDHDDSFVHSLGDLFRQTGACVRTLRAQAARKELRNGVNYDVVVLSPGPGRPDDFMLGETIDLCLKKKIPIFGVCLGFQGIIEYFGGNLNFLEDPQHGKTTIVEVDRFDSIWEGIPVSFNASLYHSLFADQIPECIVQIGASTDDIPMAIRHADLPIYGVQFHPESIITNADHIGVKIVNNLMSHTRTIG